jgi:hypothetical protein
MGIELPQELADVAAATGLSWPQADEDKLREQASAWRDAQEKLTALATDADTTAGAVTGALTGPSADAARGMWSGFVHPDHGHLTLAARGAGEAADRLTHAADQVGTAKVEMVRQLVDAAKNRDAAQTAASAGHPTALLGLDTVLHGTAANLSSLTNGLVGAVGPDGGSAPELVDPNPGAHSAHGQGGLLSTVTGVPGHLLTASPSDQQSFEDRPLLQPVHDAVVGVSSLGDKALPGLGDAVAPVAELPGTAVSAAPLTAADVPVREAAPTPDPVADGGTGPIRIGQYGGFLAPGGFDEVPTPPTGTPHIPGGTVASGFADGTYAPPVPAQPGYAPPVAGPAPVAAQPPAGGFSVAGPAPAVGPPQVAAPAPIAMPPRVGSPSVGGPPIGGPSAGGAPPRAGSPAAGGFSTGGPPAAPPRAGGAPVGGPSAGAAPASPPRRQPYPQQPYAPQSYPPPPLGAPRQERESIVALFRVHMFPIGHLPVAAVRPARQLPVPPAEVDYAPGLRFPPHDHPRSDLLDSSDALEKVRGGFSRLPSPALEPPAALTEGYDPLGGLHERDWDRRFLAGMRESVPEYAWPPGELYPEGGHEPGEPDLLPEGTLLDRFGGITGRIFAPGGTPFVQRSLPPFAVHGEYRRYRVLREVPLWTAVSAPWFGQPGGGIRYRAVYSADELVTMGYLALEEDE